MDKANGANVHNCLVYEFHCLVFQFFCMLEKIHNTFFKSAPKPKFILSLMPFLMSTHIFLSPFELMAYLCNKHHIKWSIIFFSHNAFLFTKCSFCAFISLIMRDHAILDPWVL